AESASPGGESRAPWLAGGVVLAAIAFLLFGVAPLRRLAGGSSAIAVPGEVVVGVEPEEVEPEGSPPELEKPDPGPQIEPEAMPKGVAAAGLSRTIEIAGVDTRVFEFGPEDGPVALCVHGFAAGPEMFRKLARKMADAGWRVIAFDLPGGLGTAPPPKPGPVTPQLVSFLSSAIAELSPSERPMLVAHSQGGYIAARLASEQPKLVRSVVLLGPAGLDAACWMRLISHAWVGLLFRLLVGLIGVRGRTRLAERLYRWAIGGKVGAKQFARRFADRQTALRLVGSGPVFLHEVFEEELKPGGVKVPSLYVWGTEDNTTPPTSAVQVLSEAPKATVAVLAGMGHLPMLDDPAGVAELITKWGKRRGRRAR
nr:alpha/beta hydrolase [Solirubrobacterales bacterium]